MAEQGYPGFEATSWFALLAPKGTPQPILDKVRAAALKGLADPEMQTKFAALARERIRHNPLRYYVVLPFISALDMWLRPRTEMLPIDIHWWRYEDDPRDSAIAVALGLLNLALVGTAVWSLHNWRALRYIGLLLTFVVVRTVLLQLFTPPEPRYVLECYPVVLAFAGAAFVRKESKKAA